MPYPDIAASKYDQRKCMNFHVLALWPFGGAERTGPVRSVQPGADRRFAGEESLKG